MNCIAEDEKGEHILACDANGSVTFQMAQEHINPGEVPISIVLYIDWTFMKRGMLCISKYIMVYNLLCTSIYIMIYDMLYIYWYVSWHVLVYISGYIAYIADTITVTVFSVGCLNNDLTVMGLSFAQLRHAAQRSAYILRLCQQH